MNRNFLFRCSALSGVPCRVLAFRCDEHLGRPYALRVDVDLPAELGSADLTLRALGATASLIAGTSRFGGLVFEVQLLLALADRRIYRFIVGPALQALGLGRHSRVFVDRSVPDVVESVLRSGGIADYELRLNAAYPKRHYICQYKESDLAFLHRWMEREGIYYYFVQNEEGPRLVIVDHKGGHEPGEPIHAPYRPGRWSEHVGECLQSWSRRHRGVAQGLAIGDYDYLKPALTIAESRSGVASGFDHAVRFEDNWQDPGEARRAAEVRGELLRSTQIVFRGQGNVHGLHAGSRFVLYEHPRHEFNGAYQVCRIEHHGFSLPGDSALAQVLGLESSHLTYRNVVDALPDAVQYRPERISPWPRVCGVESARVDGPADSPYAQLDAEGRYKVRLLFDEAAHPPGAASAWLRMQQPHGGAPEGIHFPLRKGAEVLVAFVHGDPDRPFILGAAPTPKTPSAVVSANETMNVIQTGGQNRLEISDVEGQTYADLWSPPERSFVHLGAHAGLGDHNAVVSTTGDGLENSGATRDVSVGGELNEQVAGSVAESSGANHTAHVAGSYSETVSSAKTQTITSGVTQTIDGGVTQTIDGGETSIVNGNVTETITGARSLDVTGSAQETFGAAWTQTVDGPVYISTPSRYVLNAPAGVTMMTPGAGTVSGISGVRLIAPGGQVTVDDWYDFVGHTHYENKFVKGAASKILRLNLEGAWLRFLTSHWAGYGVKVDLRWVDDAKWVVPWYGGALQVWRTAVQAKQASGAFLL
jgi:type VI secretion system secreted protein VgrG